MTEPTQDPNVVQQTVTPTEPGPVDPNIQTVLEGSDDSTAPNEEQIAFGAAGDVPGLVATPQGLQDGVNTTVAQDPNVAGAQVQSGAANVAANPQAGTNVPPVQTSNPAGQNIQVELQDQVGQQDRT